jgi:hypothetical protein
MQRALSIIALLLATIGAPTVLRATTITYTVNQTVGTGGVTGTITTDGTIGTLATTNIVDWNLLLNNGTTTFDLFGPLSALQSFPVVSGTDLSATMTQLLFNFSGGDNGYFFFEQQVGSIFTYWCLETSTVCTLAPPGEALAINSFFVNNQQFTALSGQQVIATAAATPEPGTSSLVLIGVGLLGLVMATRKRIAPCHQQPS